MYFASSVEATTAEATDYSVVGYSALYRGGGLAHIALVTSMQKERAVTRLMFCISCRAFRQFFLCDHLYLKMTRASGIFAAVVC